MMKNICGKYDISDVDIIIQTACNTGIDYSLYLKKIHQNLGTHSRVYLTDSGLYYYYFLSFQNSFIEIHASSCCNGNILHNFFQSCNFLLHCTYNSNTFHDL